jgi:hypothetical protein
VHSRVLAALESALETFLDRKHEAYDPFLRSVMKNSWENPVESFRLYDFSATRSFKKVPGPLDIFCEDRLFDAVRAEKPNATVIHIGLSPTKLPGVVYANGPDFSFHSSEADVVSMIRHLSGRGIRPILFHNYPRRLLQRARAMGVDAKSFSIATGSLSLIERP